MHGNKKNVDEKTKLLTMVMWAKFLINQHEQASLLIASGYCVELCLYSILLYHQLNSMKDLLKFTNTCLHFLILYIYYIVSKYEAPAVCASLHITCWSWQKNKNNN